MKNMLITLFKLIIILDYFSLHRLDIISPSRLLSEILVDDVIQPVNKAVCKTKDNNYIFAWTYYQTTSLYGINFTVFYLSSFTYSNPISVKNGISQGDLSIACLLNGGFALAWVHSYSIYSTIYEDDGKIRKPEFFVTSYSFSFTGTPKFSISPLGNGDFLIVFNNSGVYTRYITTIGQIKSNFNIQLFSYSCDLLKSFGLSNGKSVIVWTTGSYLFFRIISNDGIISTSQITVSASLLNEAKFDVSEILNIGFVITWECFGQSRICLAKYNYNGTKMSNRSLYYSDPKIIMVSPSLTGIENGAYLVSYNYKLNNLYYIAGAIYDNADNLINYDELGVDSVFKPILTPSINGGFGLIYESIDKKLKFHLYPYCVDFSIQISKPEIFDFRKAILFGYMYVAEYRIVGLPSKGTLTVNGSPVSISQYYSMTSLMLFTPDSSDTIFKFSIKLPAITNYEMTCSATVYFICYSSCKSCISTGDESNHNCLECKASNFPLIDKFSQCYPTNQIVTGYYFNITYKLFYKCVNNCKICVDGSSCSECLSGYIYYQNQCLSSCPNATFIDPITGKKQCVNECPDYYYGDSVSKICVSCIDGCKKCDTSGCIQCDLTSYIDSITKKCLSICPDGSYLDPNLSTCVACYGNCLKCINLTTCYLCETNYFLVNNKFCLSSCPKLTYIDGNSCKSCINFCSECIDGISCKTCLSNYFLYNGKCYDKCPDKYYADINSNSCKPCNSNCDICSNALKCDKCEIGYYLNQSGNCVLNCGQFFYENTQISTCESCISSCEDCVNNLECNKCITRFYLQPDKSCKDSCQTGYFGNLQIGRCQPCISRCDVCYNSTECSQCTNGYFLDINKKCVITCGQNYYADKLSGKCQSCLLNCLNCINNTQCTTCKDGYYVQPDKSCDIKCPTGYFINYDTAQCESCVSNCQSCDNSSKCNICNLGVFLNSNYLCTTDCGNEYYKDSITGKCEKCIINCTECKNDYQCTKCKVNFNLLPDKTCGSNCPVSFYPSSSFNCAPCISKCDSCSDSITCSKCSSGYYLAPSKTCANECDPGYYEDTITGRCVGCISNCEKCDNNRECIKCISSYYLLPSCTCTKICPVAFYANTSALTCISCIPNCLKCEDSTNCVKCIPGYFFDPINKRCVSNCGPENFVNTLIGRCEKCTNNCLVCNNSVECIKCKNNFFLQPDSTCQAGCPLRYFANPDTGMCGKCNDNCYECENSVDCISCIQTMFLLELNNFKKCQTNCPADYNPNIEKRKCEKIVIDICLTRNPCQNNGVCKVKDNIVNCECKQGFNGKYCENNIPALDDGNTDNGSNNNGDNENDDTKNNNGENDNQQNNLNNTDIFTNQTLPEEPDKLLEFANTQMGQMLSGNIPPSPKILDVSSTALSSTISTLLTNTNNPTNIDIDQFQKQVDEIKSSIGSLTDVLLKTTELSEPVIVSSDLFTVQLQFTSTITKRRRLTSIGANIGNSTIIESDNCVQEIKQKNNIPNRMPIIMKQIDYSSNFNLTSINDSRRNSSNTFIIEFYHPITKQKFNTSLCKDMTIKVRSPNKKTLSNYSIERYKQLLSNGVDVFNPESQAFHSRCLILKDPETDRDTTVNYRIENYFSNKIVKCGGDCEYEKIDDYGYVVCNCSGFPSGEVITNTFYSYKLETVSHSNLNVLFCGNVAFKTLLKNPAFYFSTFFLMTNLILVIFYSKLDIKLIHDRLEDIIHFDCQFYKHEEMSYEDYFNYISRKDDSKSPKNFDSDNSARNNEGSINPPKKIKVNNYMTFNEKQINPIPVGGVPGINLNNLQNNQDINNNSNLAKINQNLEVTALNNNGENNNKLDNEKENNLKRKRRKQRTRNMPGDKETQKKEVEISEIKRHDHDPEITISIIPNKNQDKSEENMNNNQNNFKNLQIKSNLTSRQPQLLNNYFEFKDNDSIVNPVDVTNKSSDRIVNFENKLEINSSMVSDESTIPPKKPKNIYDIYPNHVPTLRDYYDLSPKDAITCDKRGFKMIFLQNLAERHIICEITYKVSLLSPFWLRILLLFLELQLIFGLNAILFTDKYIDARSKSDAASSLFYTLNAEFPKIFFSILFTWIILKLCKLIATVPKEYKELLNEALKMRTIPIVEKAFLNLRQNMSLRYITLFVSTITLHFCCWYYVIVFCGIYTGTASAWIYSSIVCVIFYWGVVLIVICLWQAFIRISARKYRKLRFLEC